MIVTLYALPYVPVIVPGTIFCTQSAAVGPALLLLDVHYGRVHAVETYDRLASEVVIASATAKGAGLAHTRGGVEELSTVARSTLVGGPVELLTCSA